MMSCEGCTFEKLIVRNNILLNSMIFDEKSLTEIHVVEQSQRLDVLLLICMKCKLKDFNQQKDYSNSLNQL